MSRLLSSQWIGLVLAVGIGRALSAGPGWDWDTTKSLDPDVATYTEQLRALEGYQRANPMSAETRFVLAYHYLVLGHIDAAVKQLENVVKLLRESQLSAELLAALKAESSPPSPSTGVKKSAAAGIVCRLPLDPVVRRFL